MQEIVTYIIIYAAIGVSLYNAYQALSSSRKKTSCCGDGGCGCSAKTDLLVHIKKNKKFKMI